jgi:RecA/RadA recombinase
MASKWKANLIAENESARKKINDRLKGEGLLYSGDPALNWGNGGFARGRVNILWGPKGSGKTTIALKACGDEQKKTKGDILIFCSEWYHDPLKANYEETQERYRKAGIDPERVLARSSNQVNVLFKDLNDIESEIKNGDLDISAILVDSWGGIQSEHAAKKIEDGELSSAGNSYGGNSKTLTPILQTLLRISAENGITMFIIQHCMRNMEGYGPDYLMLGGEKFQHLADTNTFLESIEAKESSLLVGDEVGNKGTDRIGKKIRFQCYKSRTVVEGRKGEFWMDFENVRFAKPAHSLFDLATGLGVIAHPKTPILNDDGTPKMKDNKPLFKENVQSWIFPIDVPTPFSVRGKENMIAALEKEQDLYNQVYLACMQSNKKETNPQVLEKPTEEDSVSAKKGKKK